MHLVLVKSNVVTFSGTKKLDNDNNNNLQE